MMPHTPTTRRRPARQALIGLFAATTLTGCGMTSWLEDDEAPPPVIEPNEFVRVAPDEEQPTNGTTPTKPENGSTTDTTPGTASSGVAENNTTTSPRLTSDNALPVNAMVGHINSEAVYADQIFDINLAAQLQAFGQRFDGEQFLVAAGPRIQEKLRGVIINKLILGEAELNLKDQQRQYIDLLVNKERDELIRFYGQGSISKARAEFRKAKGEELDTHLTNLREEYAVQAYLQQKVMPKIAINQIMVEKYYEDNKKRFNQPDMRSFRIIRVANANAEEVVKTIEARLKGGASFKDIASDPELNLYNPDGSGLFNSGNPVPGEQVYGIAPVNKALMTLEEGKHAGPFVAGKHHYYTQLVTFKPGIEIPLVDAQLEIEEILRSKEYERLVLRLRMGMLERGSYTAPEKMGVKLLKIAAARYDQ